MSKTISFTKEVPDELYSIMSDVARICFGVPIEQYVWGAAVRQLPADIDSELPQTAFNRKYMKKAERYANTEWWRTLP